ncbi:MAG: pyruvate ferredoxin oxidoreductase [Actinobacteria bacterium HGW-Actinobacteria-7]|jgi:indolepyruvate ferredoxin oxidoreductase beta subunit|nr:MAG: pyruvate ferredoxin oxidoreductase [Actinobacteria bacterium HGW-Actinobacteria-7]
MLTTVMLCGVGGQGTILAADLLAKVAAAEGLEVKLSEVHGMSQRGGSVDTVVKYGDELFSPVTDPGMVDHMVAFELMEAMRRIHYVRPDGRMLVNPRAIQPLPVLTGDLPAPHGMQAILEEEGAIFIDADLLACEAGSPKSANVVLMGALSWGLPFALETWNDVIASRVPPKTIEANLNAFQLGRAACQKGECAR